MAERVRAGEPLLRVVLDIGDSAASLMRSWGRCRSGFSLSLNGSAALRLAERLTQEGEVLASQAARAGTRQVCASRARGSP